MIKLRTRIEQDNVRAEATMTDQPEWARESGWDAAANWYTVTLRMSRRQMTVPFGMGSAHTSEPDAAHVLSCLLSDASGADEDFENWARDLGYDTDSRRAERTYRQVQAQTAKLRAFLGDKFDAYMYETEQL